MSAHRRKAAKKQSGPSRHSAAQARQAAADRARLEAHRRQRRLVLLVGLAVMLVVVGIGVGFQIRETYRAPVAGPAVAAGRPVSVTAGRPISWGAPDAPVTVDLWADFHCPHCVEFEDRYGALLSRGVADGTVRLHTYPLAFVDAGSRSASNAYACAAEAGFAEPYFGALFANSDLRWSDHQLTALFEQVAGAPSPEFTACVEDRRHDAWVTSLSEAAEEAGVGATPSMSVDGEPVDVEALTPETLTTTIEEAAQQ